MDQLEGNYHIVYLLPNVYTYKHIYLGRFTESKIADNHRYTAAPVVTASSAACHQLRTFRSKSFNAAKGFTGRCLFSDRAAKQKDLENRQKFEKLSCSMNTKKAGETVHEAAEIKEDDTAASLTCIETDFIAREICSTKKAIVLKFNYTNWMQYFRAKKPKKL